MLTGVMSSFTSLRSLHLYITPYISDSPIFESRPVSSMFRGLDYFSILLNSPSIRAKLQGLTLTILLCFDNNTPSFGSEHLDEWKAMDNLMSDRECCPVLRSIIIRVRPHSMIYDPDDYEQREVYRDTARKVREEIQTYLPKLYTAGVLQIECTGMLAEDTLGSDSEE